MYLQTNSSLRGVPWLFLKLGPTKDADYWLGRARPLKSGIPNQNIDIYEDNFIGQTLEKPRGLHLLSKT